MKLALFGSVMICLMALLRCFQIRIVHDLTQLATSERDTTQRLKHLLKSQELLLKAQDKHFLTRALMR